VAFLAVDFLTTAFFAAPPEAGVVTGATPDDEASEEALAAAEVLAAGAAASLSDDAAAPRSACSAAAAGSSERGSKGRVERSSSAFAPASLPATPAETFLTTAFFAGRTSPVSAAGRCSRVSRNCWVSVDGRTCTASSCCAGVLPAVPAAGSGRAPYPAEAGAVSDSSRRRISTPMPSSTMAARQVPIDT
jgi:hypothetical protein